MKRGIIALVILALCIGGFASFNASAISNEDFAPSVSASSMAHEPRSGLPVAYAGRSILQIDYMDDYLLQVPQQANGRNFLQFLSQYDSAGGIVSTTGVFSIFPIPNPGNPLTWDSDWITLQYHPPLESGQSFDWNSRPSLGLPYLHQEFNSEAGSFNIEVWYRYVGTYRITIRTRNLTHEFVNTYHVVIKNGRLDVASEVQIGVRRAPTGARLRYSTSQITFNTAAVGMFCNIDGRRPNPTFGDPSLVAVRTTAPGQGQQGENILNNFFSQPVRSNNNRTVTLTQYDGSTLGAGRLFFSFPMHYFHETVDINGVRVSTSHNVTHTLEVVFYEPPVHLGSRWWHFLVAGLIMGALLLGVYACNWMIEYTSQTREAKKEARVSKKIQREIENFVAMQEEFDRQLLEPDYDDILTQDEIDSMYEAIKKIRISDNEEIDKVDVMPPKKRK